MKKFIKTVAALSATAILAIPANMTAFAYRVDTGKSFSNPLINYDFSAGRGQQWAYQTGQDNLPALTKTILEAKGKYTYYATTDTRCNEYGNCDMFALLPLDVATTATINNARPYVDNLSVKTKSGKYYALVMEYADVSRTDSHAKRPSIKVNDKCCDYGLRMLEGPYLQNILNNLYFDNPDDINYNYIKQHNGYTGNIYLDDYYVAGMRITSTDHYTTFDEPVLEQKPSGKGFRTKITFHISNPASEDKRTTYLGFNGSTAGNTTYDVLANMKLSCNGDSSYYVKNYISIGGVSKKTLTVPISDIKEYNNLYQGLISCPGFETQLRGNAAEYFYDNRFNAYKYVGNTVYIYTGKKAGIGFDDWLNGWGQTKFDCFFSCGGRDILGHCESLKIYLQNATTVRFYCDSTPTSVGTEYYSCDASYLLRRIERG